ncbi:unnamed protein product [Rotaria sp. Silwood2]|nr:unnamed protein product [Rotaria sp. Silwood2]CAF2894034.1 unnamed protein product [Rotaria sp. Silwood2]CAF3348441.1 unnamed protein product [Rotaria sp. Silwood2]CAF4362299.1 unnamed protein product [Rotaria sp. Silwood2]CAF4382942.1 unnamed protein product [Rotaria sp. Silwood2]
MLNKALRMQDFDVLFSFRWFIADMHRQMSQYQCQCPLRVYRGQLMTNTEVERLKRSIGKLISFSSFLSASLLEQQAVFYQNNVMTSSGFQRVLFEIDADPQVVINKPFADLSSHSDFAGECEVLFMLGCVFRINNVSHRGVGHGWSIHMTLFDDSDHHLSGMIEEIQAINENSPANISSFGILLWKMGKYDLAEKYLRRSIEESSSNDPELGSTYLNLGLVYSEKGNHSESLHWYNEALLAYMQIKKPNHVAIGNLYNNIGEAYRQRGDCVEAMDSYNTALSIFEEAHDEHHSTMGLIYNNIGIIHHNQGNYLEALDFYERARAIYQERLHAYHSNIALAYNNIGAVHFNLGNVDIALEYYERAVSVYSKSLPPSHPALALTYHNIGRVYEMKREFSQAWQYYQKALEIRQHALPPQHPELKEAEQSVRNIAVKL